MKHYNLQLRGVCDRIGQVGYLLLVGFLATVPSLGANEADRSSIPERPIIHRMRRVNVDSEAIASIGYHRKTQTLEVKFRSGATYRYAGVPRRVFQDFIASESKGNYFRERVRGRYAYWRITK